MRFWRLVMLLSCGAIPVIAVPGQELVALVRESRSGGKSVTSETSAYVRMTDLNGVSYVSLVQAAVLVNGTSNCKPPSLSCDLRVGGQQLKFTHDSPQVQRGAVSTPMENPAIRNAEGFWIPFSFLSTKEFERIAKVRIVWPPPPTMEEPVVSVSTPTKTVRPAVAPVPQAESKQAVLQAKALKRIVLDPGHGGKDPGAVGPGGAMEKEVNLAVALDLADTLRDEYGYQVLLTRMDDTFVPLEGRSRMANKHDADLFISLHCNAATSSKLRGFEVYFLSENASDPHADEVARLENAALTLEGKDVPSPSRVKQVLRSLEITANINEASTAGALLDRHLADRLSEPSLGVKQAAFYVLRGAEMPAVLIEMGFISNRKEEKLLTSKSFRKRLVEGIAAGIAAYDLRKQKERS